MKDHIGKYIHREESREFITQKLIKKAEKLEREGKLKELEEMINKCE